ncbi:hypothetical protein [Methanobrevibacter sp.]
MIEISQETFKTIASKLQDDLANIIQNKKQVNEYELIVYKYMFISELKIPLFDEMEIEIAHDSFMVHIIPDDLEFNQLKKLDEAFDKFDISFMPNSYNLLKLRFKLISD